MALADALRLVAALSLCLCGSAERSPTSIDAVERWGVFEGSLSGPSAGNPFVDVALSVTFTHESHARPDEHTDSSTRVVVSGFYDGEGRYLFRFSPALLGTWQYTTASASTPALAGHSGSFTCVGASPGNHGPVHVDPTDPSKRAFAYADGTPHVSVGSTAYAWCANCRQRETERDRDRQRQRQRQWVCVASARRIHLTVVWP